MSLQSRFPSTTLSDVFFYTWFANFWATVCVTANFLGLGTPDPDSIHTFAMTWRNKPLYYRPIFGHYVHYSFIFMIVFPIVVVLVGGYLSLKKNRNL